jgi:hypothetical protein
MEMNVEGAGRRTPAELVMELQTGARFVVFQYCVSLLVVTFKRNSDAYLIKPGESAAGTGLRYTLLSLLLGWWGLPWGLIYTLESIVINLQGGRDVTQEVVRAALPAASAQERVELERLASLVPAGAAAGQPRLTTDEFGQLVSGGGPFTEAGPTPWSRRRQMLGLAAMVAAGLGVLALALVGLAQWGQRTDSLKAGQWGLSVQATATWEARLAMPTATVAPGYVSYTNEDLGFQVHHPEGWLVEVSYVEKPGVDDVDSGTVDFSAPADAPEDVLGLWVQSVTLGPGSSTASLTDQEYLELANSIMVEDQELQLSEGPSLLDVDGFRAAHVVYTLTESYTSQTAAGRATLLLAEDRVFVIGGTTLSQNHERLRSVYDHFLTSFQVLPVP